MTMSNTRSPSALSSASRPSTIRTTFASVRAPANTPTATAVHLVDRSVIRPPCPIVNPSTPPAKGGCLRDDMTKATTEDVATDGALGVKSFLCEVFRGR